MLDKKLTVYSTGGRRTNQCRLLTTALSTGFSSMLKTDSAVEPIQAMCCSIIYARKARKKN
jgi:hypothetical protein